MEHEVLTIKQAAELLQVSPQFIRTMAREKRVPYVKLGSDYRFNRQALLDALYFDAMAGYKNTTNLPVDTVLEWVMRFRSHRDLSETNLVKAAQQACRELRELSLDPERPVCIDVIKDLAAALEKVEVFDPETVLERKRRRPA